MKCGILLTRVVKDATLIKTIYSGFYSWGIFYFFTCLLSKCGVDSGWWCNLGLGAHSADGN